MLGRNLKNPRVLAILFLGFSSSLPLALTGSTLQAWFTKAGVNLLTIGALTLIGVPYFLKFFWAPIVDRFVPPFLGRRRGWIMLMQLGIALALLLMAQMNPILNTQSMIIIAFVIAFFSATQDIVFDAYRTDVLLPEERGIGSAYLIFGLRISLLISGGLALIFADYVGWKVLYEIMALLMALCMLATYFAPETSRMIVAPTSLKAAIINPFKDLLKRDGIFLMLLFIVLYKIGDALALSLMSNFLLHELGFSLTQVGLVYKTFGLFATIFGAFIGGLILIRVNLFKALLFFGFAQAFSNLAFMGLAMAGKNLTLMVMSIFIENFCSGMSTAALVTFLMTLCHKDFSATQYAFFSAIASIGRIFIGPFAALLVQHAGWVSFYGWSFLISFPGIVVLTMLRTKVSSHAQAVA